MHQVRRCTAVVVSFNSSAELPGCLESLLAQRGVEMDVHVVDNASTDGSARLVQERYPAVHLRTNAANAGFGRANNQILTAVRAPYFAVVNPDTVLSPDVVAVCLDHLETHPRTALVGARLANRDGTMQPSCHAFLGLRNLFGEVFLLDRLLPGFAPLSSLNMTGFPHDRVAEVGWVQGSFMVVRGEACAQVGVFDPDFFMYGEEMDWCYRFHQGGWKVVYLPEPSVVHLGGASSRPIAGPMFVENLKGHLRFLRKHRGPAVLLAGRALIAASVLLRCLGREAQAGLSRLAGRPVSEAVRLRRVMFRSAAVWVLQGMPISPPEISGARTA